MITLTKYKGYATKVQVVAVARQITLLDASGGINNIANWAEIDISGQQATYNPTTPLNNRVYRGVDAYNVYPALGNTITHYDRRAIPSLPVSFKTPPVFVRPDYA